MFQFATLNHQSSTVVPTKKKPGNGHPPIYIEEMDDLKLIFPKKMGDFP